jgi:hypothetical protein
VAVSLVNSEHLSVGPVSYTIQGVYLHLIEVPIMNLWRRRQNESDILIRDSFMLLAPIAATCAMILLFFYG